MKRGESMDQVRIGKFISENRKKENLTQEELAMKLGVSKNAVSKWERGINLPDVSIMQELCKLLNITLNELFSGERIPENKYKEVADSNLLDALKNNVFTLKDKVDYFKKKWEKDHFLESIIIMFLIVGFIIYGFIKDNGLQYLFMGMGFISGIIENNRKMAYIEKNAYGKKSEISINDFRTYIQRMKELKKIIAKFDSKEEAINFLVKETGISKQECTEAYDFMKKLDLNQVIKNFQEK